MTTIRSMRLSVLGIARGSSAFFPDVLSALYSAEHGEKR